MTATTEVLIEIGQERTRQEAKWGEQNWHVGGDRLWAMRAERAKAQCTEAAQEGTLTWRHILAEEFYEVFENEDTDPEAQRAELVQVAAVAVAAIEAIDRRSRVAATILQFPACYATEASDPSGNGEGQAQGAGLAQAPPPDSAPDVA